MTKRSKIRLPVSIPIASGLTITGHLKDLPDTATEAHADVLKMQQVFGYTFEDLRISSRWFGLRTDRLREMTPHWRRCRKDAVAIRLF